MIQDPVWFITHIIVGLTDVAMIFLASRAAINDSFTIKKIKFKHQFSFSKIRERSRFSHNISSLELLLGIFYAIVIFFIDPLFNSRLALHLVIMICMIMFAKLFSKERLYTCLTIYIIFFLFSGIIQTPLLPIFSFFDLPHDTRFILIQFASLVGMIFLTHGFKMGRLGTLNFMNRIFLLNQQKLAFKIITLILFVFALGFPAARNFDMNVGARQALLFIPLIILPFYGIWDILNSAQKKVNAAVRKTHDYNQKLYGLHTSLQLLAGDNEEIMRESSEILQLINKDITLEKITNYTRDMAIFGLLDDKVEKLKSKGISIVFYPSFKGEEKHQIVSFSDTIAMTLSLVTNAIDHGDHRFPIWVDVLIESDTLQIAVANASPSKNDFEQNKMFIEGYSTIPTIGRGHGLSNLKNDLLRYEKEGFTSGVLTNSFYNTRKSTDYLIVAIYVVKSSVKLNVNEINLKKELLS